jgi:hypothetical protein
MFKNNQCPGIYALFVVILPAEHQIMNVSLRDDGMDERIIHNQWGHYSCVPNAQFGMPGNKVHHFI